MQRSKEYVSKIRVTCCGGFHVCVLIGPYGTGVLTFWRNAEFNVHKLINN